MTKESSFTIKQRFGKAIRKRRRELDLSQEVLAEKADLHRTYISNLERGEINPTLESIERLTQALEITIARLLLDYDVEED